MTAGQPSVAVVVHRYGAEVGGGAEAHARLLAHLLLARAEVTVLTTCARDYRTWEDHYPAGAEQDGDVRVLRFPVPSPRDPDAFDRLSHEAFARPGDVALGTRWMHAQGPVAPDLLAHLDAHGGAYDAVVFVTYLYATTVLGLPRVAARSLLLPTLHDEPPARLAVFDPVFAGARAILFNTPEERDFAQARFAMRPGAARIAGVGVDPPPPADASAFAAARGIRRPYVLCVGRLDAAKGVDALVAHHAAYRAAHPDGADLVLVGRGPLALPAAPWLHRTGFVEEHVKHAALAGALAVVVPSPYESLSLSQLDAWTHGRPTLANAASPVLVGQSRRTGGGLWYRDAGEYSVMLDALARNPALADALGRQGRRGARALHSWERVADAWWEAIAAVRVQSEAATA
ncbi:MAG TPA: glycosyltransferase family 4 protein [Miltoncostaeaceae bacterium]|nr:glycosyltransferase family 4 protein [Miltoncostaeaceae bacterium]